MKELEAKLRSTMASWTMMYDVGGGTKVHVEAQHAPDMQRFTFFLSRGATKQKWLEMTERDGAWFVVEGDKQGKYGHTNTRPKSRIRIYFSIQPS